MTRVGWDRDCGSSSGIPVSFFTRSVGQRGVRHKGLLPTETVRRKPPFVGTGTGTGSVPRRSDRETCQDGSEEVPDPPLSSLSPSAMRTLNTDTNFDYQCHSNVAPVPQTK